MIDDPQDGLEDPEDLDDIEEGQTEERPTRGIVWIIGPTVLGLLLGTGYRAATLARAVPLELASGAAVGAGVGLAVGAIIWAFFPYKSATKTNRREE